MTVFDIIRKIQSTSSQNQKLEILHQHKENEKLKQVLHFTYNPQIITGLNKKKIEKELKITSDLEDMGMYNLYLALNKYCLENCEEKDTIEIIEHNFLLEGIGYLEEHNTGTDKDIYFIQQCLSYIKQESNKEIAKEIYTKTLNIGLTAKSINKVFGKDFISIWEVQQGYPLEDYPFKDGEWFCISQKMNGCRATLYNGEFISRQGKMIAGFDYIKDEIKKYISNEIVEKYVFDGELQLINDGTRTDNENYQVGTGIINSDDESKPNFEFVIFDIVLKDEFENDKVKNAMTFKERLDILREVRTNFTGSKTIPSPKSVRVVDHYYDGFDKSQIKKWLDFTEEKGYEGCMVNLDVPYKRKRHRGILKVKKFFESDLEIIGVEEGKSKSTLGTLGAFVVDFKGSKVNVGSGFTKAQRDQFWTDRDNLVGRVITVRYKNITTNKKDDSLSLQFPIFVELRELGKEISY